MQGGDGDDILRGGAGADILLGGAGNDLVSYFTSTAGVTVNLTTGIHRGGDAEGDSFLDTIERVNGSNFADTLVGAAGNETLGGQAGDDRLLGMAGSDILDGGAGADLLDGGDQNDTLRGGMGGDTFLGGDGIDTVQYSDSTAGVSVNLTTGVNHGGAAEGDRFFDRLEILQGSAYADTIVGSLLHDLLWGGGGNGDDWMQGNAGADSFTGGAGTDTVSYVDSIAGVRLNLATNVNHGGSAEGDRFLDHVELVLGSGFADIMVGDGLGSALWREWQ